ncbi:MAG TPA: universal stress protein [Chloroflexota bacterium]|nr:universal stress protein [Chloroflexota bacterium]
MFHRVLVGFDGSPSGWCALRHGIQVAKEDGADLWALSVEEPLPHYASAANKVQAEGSAVAAYFERLQAEAQREAESHAVALQTETVHGHAAQAIVDFASQIRADLIIVGQHGHRGVMKRLLGSTSDRVVDIAPCSVLVVRSDDTTP